MTERASVCQRFWSHFDGWLDGIDVLIYGGLGAALLGYVVYSIGLAIHEAGNRLVLAAFVAVVTGSVGLLVRDLFRKQLSRSSKLLVGAWGACVALVLVVELFESFN